MSSNLIGKRVNGYEIIRVLGRGGMGVVYKAHEMTLQRVLALKVLPQHLAENKEFITRFYREARAAAQLNHPNVVTIHRVGEDDGYHYIAMEYLKGRELTDIIKERKQIDVKEAIDVTRQVASALAAAHELGILHRDIKPHNVMIDESGRIKVMDFGIAKLNEPGDGTHGITMTGQLLGTPAYMSPEQCKGQSADARSDIYSLGVVLYQMLAGRVPYTGETPLAVMRKIVEDPLPDVKEFAQEVPAAVTYIMERALAKDQEKRYASASEMEEDCKRFLGGQEIAALSRTDASGLAPVQTHDEGNRTARMPGAAGAAGAGTQGPGLAKSRGFQLALAGLLVLGAAGMFAYVKIAISKKHQKDGGGGLNGTQVAGGSTPQAAILTPTPIPPTPTPNETPKPPPSAEPTDTPKPQPTPMIPAPVTPRPNHKPTAAIQLSAAKIDQGQPIEVTFSTADADDDPLKVAYRLNKTNWVPLGPADLAKGTFAPPPESFRGGENVIELKASDEKEFAMATDKFVVVPKNTPAPRATTMAATQPSGQAGAIGDALSGHTANVSSLAVSPDGSKIVSGGQDNQAIVWNFKSGEKIATLAGHGKEVSAVAFSPDGSKVLTGSGDTTVRVWDAASGKELMRFENHQAEIVNVAFSSDGKFGLSASKDGMICKWEAATRSEVGRLAAGRINCAAFSPNGHLAITGTSNGDVQVWDIDGKSSTGTMPRDVAKGIGHSRSVLTAAFSGDGKRALTGSLDTRICLWDVDRQQQLRAFEGHKAAVQSVAFSHDGRYAISGGKDKSVRVWDADTGDQVEEWHNHTETVLAVAMSPGSATAVSGGVDKTVRRWRW